jgi:hypothetical protein
MLAFAAQELQAAASPCLPSTTTSWELASLGVRRADEAGAAAGAVAASMAAAGYPDADVRDMHAALLQALHSAVQADPSGEVRVRYVLSPQEARAEVQNQGPAKPLTLRQCRSAR